MLWVLSYRPYSTMYAYQFNILHVHPPHICDDHIRKYIHYNNTRDQGLAGLGLNILNLIDSIKHAWTLRNTHPPVRHSSLINQINWWVNVNPLWKSKTDNWFCSPEHAHSSKQSSLLPIVHTPSTPVLPLPIRRCSICIGWTTSAQLGSFTSL